MPEYKIRFSHAGVRGIEGWSDREAERVIRDAAYAVAEALEKAGYDALINGDPQCGYFDGGVLTDKRLDPDTERALTEDVLRGFQYPLEIVEL